MCDARDHCSVGQWWFDYTIPSVNDSLTDEVSELRDFETLGESIAKIKTLIAELKIDANFKEVIPTFPLNQ